MNRSSRLAALAFASLLPATVHASEFADFRIPDHTWSTAGLSLSGGGNRTRLNSDQSIRTLDLNGALVGRGSIVRETEPWQASLWLEARTAWTRHEERIRSHDGQSDHEGDDRHAGENLGAEVELRAYPGGGPLAVALRGTSEHAFARFEFDHRNWLAARVPALVASAEERWLFRERLALDLTFGLGRVRNATGVYQALLLERRWLETGALSRRLSPEARTRLAQLFYLQSPYASVHQRPNKGFWGEVERIARDDGAFADEGLDAYSVHRALEPPHDGVPVFGRLVGWFAGPVAGAGASRDHNRQSLRYSSSDGVSPPVVTEIESRFQSYRDFVYAGGRVEAHVPVGLEGQLDGRSEIRHVTHQTGPLERKDLSLSSEVSYTQLWSERWSLLGWASHDRDLMSLDTEFEGGTWSVGYGLNVGLFVEDRLRLSLGVSEWQYRQPDSFTVDAYQRTTQFGLGLTYQLFGFLDAPGLVSTSLAEPVSRAGQPRSQ